MICVTFYRDDSLGKLELPRLVSQAGAWETAKAGVPETAELKTNKGLVFSSCPSCLRGNSFT